MILKNIYNVGNDDYDDGDMLRCVTFAGISRLQGFPLPLLLSSLVP